MTLHSRIISVADYDNFRDELAGSGVFEMTDCAVEIWCPEDSDVKEVQKMVKLLESMVHITDVRIGSSVEDMAASKYRVVITETPLNHKKRFSRER